MVFAMFGILWVMPRRVIYLFACWQGHLGRHPNSDIESHHSYFMWCLRQERNGQTFEYVNRAFLS